jgi:Lrp/AsnC family leucine-responsive transcriptional regulator
MALKIDDLDQKLLSILHRDYQINMKTLASMLNISQTPLRKRMKKLTKAGYVSGSGRRVGIDKSKFPNAIAANIRIALNDLKESTISLFKKDTSAIACIEYIQDVSGNADYQLTFLFKDEKEKDDFLLNKISQISGLKTHDCLCVLKEIHQRKFRTL